MDLKTPNAELFRIISEPLKIPTRQMSWDREYFDYATRTVTPSSRSALEPERRLALLMSMMRISLGMHRASATGPLYIIAAVEIIYYRSGTVLGSSDTT